MTKRVLIIDDDQPIQDAVAFFLREAGFQTFSALDGDEGLALLLRERPDLVLLDRRMPGISDTELYHALKQEDPAVPIIMLTSLGEEHHRVVGLELGADDYIVKPFNSRELVARVRNVLRRCTPPAEDERIATPAPTPIRAAGIELHPESYSVRFHDRELRMTRGEYLLTATLVGTPRKVFSRMELVERIHDGDFPCTERAIDQLVARVRRKLKKTDADADPIQTIHGIGYRMREGTA